MALIAAPDEGYDSLVTLAAANQYASDMSLSAWTGTDAVKEAALRRATQFLLSRYRIKTEYLDPVHKNVAAACCEAAARALSGPLSEDVSAAVVTGESVGPISVTYSANQRNSGRVRYVLIDDLLSGLTDGAFGMVKLVRA